MCVATDTARTTQRVGAEIQGIADTGIDAVKTMVPDLGTVAALPKVAVGAMTEIGSAWIEWMDRTTRAGTQISQRLLWQAVEQQQRLAANAMQGWMDQNARIMKITMQVAREVFRPFANSTGGSDDRAAALVDNGASVVGTLPGGKRTPARLRFIAQLTRRRCRRY